MSAAFAAVSAPVLVAHQGGWDEVLLVGGPMLAIAGLLWLAKRRVVAAQRPAQTSAEQSAAERPPTERPPTEQPAPPRADRPSG